MNVHKTVLNSKEKLALHIFIWCFILLTPLFALWSLIAKIYIYSPWEKVFWNAVIGYYGVVCLYYKDIMEHIYKKRNLTPSQSF